MKGVEMNDRKVVLELDLEQFEVIYRAVEFLNGSSINPAGINIEKMSLLDGFLTSISSAIIFNKEHKNIKKLEE